MGLLRATELRRDLRLYPRPSHPGRLKVAEEAVMTMTMHEQASARSSPGRWAARLLVPEMWATLSIVAMWLAVLFVGVFGGDMTFRGADTSFTVIPAGVAVAVFAAIGT